MTFQQGGQFEGGRVRQSRGGGRGGGRGLAVGGGAGGLVVLVLALLFGGDVGSMLTGGRGGTGGAAQVEDVGSCTAEQANTDRTCRLSATAQALDEYWQPELERLGAQIPGVESFEGATDTGCGAASASTGPFYCPPDQTIYLDLGFYDLLASRFGASDGPLAEIYVTAHEYGHHLQNVLGTFASADRSGTGEGSDSVRLELQADCYAGMFVGDAATTVDPDTGVTFLEPITAEQLRNALDAAAAVGDDSIQAQGGQVNPDSWTHGSSEQRQTWFTTGYEQGSLDACDTFAVAQP
ncbi:neutral zinc metallopeptidase [Cellulomonas endophytica]|uniref:KPN_02809 family neutral zinc metallopeptidase n=1 Tax=Cellulomonas endophytica TaxID=2494735 RepID=UPI001011E3F8|nr:neutral zinc metallopeptidase [Cellulomonas endophytica]